MKNPRLQFSERWAWLFPMHKPCRHPRTSETVRYRVLESMAQRAVRRAVERLGTDMEIVPHLLRHAWATHAKLHLGADLVDLRAGLGHKDISTTMRYLAGAAAPVRSPMQLVEHMDHHG